MGRSNLPAASFSAGAVRSRAVSRVRGQSGHYLCERAVENVKRAVVLIVLHVVDEVFHLQLDGVSLIVLPAFELLVPVLFPQSAQRPLVTGLPLRRRTRYHNRLVQPLILLHELVRGNVVHVNAGHCVADCGRVQVERLCISQSCPSGSSLLTQFCFDTPVVSMSNSGSRTYPVVPFAGHRRSCAPLSGCGKRGRPPTSENSRERTRLGTLSSARRPLWSPLSSHLTCSRQPLTGAFHSAKVAIDRSVRSPQLRMERECDRFDDEEQIRCSAPIPGARLKIMFMLSEI